MDEIKHRFNSASERIRATVEGFNAAKGVADKSKYAVGLAKSSITAGWDLANKYPGRYFGLKMLSRGSAILLLGLPVLASLSIAAVWASLPAMNQVRIHMKETTAVERLRYNVILFKHALKAKKLERRARRGAKRNY